MSFCPSKMFGFCSAMTFLMMVFSAKFLDAIARYTKFTAGLGFALSARVSGVKGSMARRCVGFVQFWFCLSCSRLFAAL